VVRGRVQKVMHPHYVHNSIERRHIYSPLVFRCDICWTAQIDSTYTAEYWTTHRIFFLSARGIVCFSFCFFVFVAWGGRGKCDEGG
jgi:hypothetical protein